MYRSAVRSFARRRQRRHVYGPSTGRSRPSFRRTAAGTLPQSVELKVQSGIAPGWLAFGSVKWTDWSVLDTLDYTILPAARLAGAARTRIYLPGRLDGDRRCRPLLQRNHLGRVGLTWDRGVSTTEDTLSDTYTAAAGVAIKDKLGGEVRFGGAISYLTSASVAAERDQPAASGRSRRQLRLYGRRRLGLRASRSATRSPGKSFQTSRKSPAMPGFFHDCITVLRRACYACARIRDL